MQVLIEQLNQLAGTPPARVTFYGPELQLFGGLEMRRPPAPYLWDGMRRGGDAAHPYLIFQYTLEGWGCYAAQGQAHRVEPGVAFTAIIPSEHSYYLPDASSGWMFFWLLIRHPYIVGRIAERQQESGALLRAEPGSPLIRSALELFTHVCRPSARDALAHERALFEFLWEHERAASRDREASEGQRLLVESRRYVIEVLARPIGVGDLAAHHGMSRSHFSHVFKAATGLAPAQFIQQTRLEEAMRHLIHTGQPVASIAGATGFANANHFCKVFRQRFHLSPGAFRRQVRG
jgi:AraC-like DNA-binding protein